MPDNDPRIIHVLCRTNTGYINNGFPENITLVVDRSPPKILSAKAIPEYAIERVEVTLEVKTDDPSLCRFDRTEPDPNEFLDFFENAVASQFKTTNTLVLNSPTIQDNMNYTYLASCMNKAGMFAEEIRRITFMIYLSAPNLITDTSPKGAIKTTSTDMGVNTTRDSVCRYGTAEQGLLNFFPQQHSKVHFIQKQNLEEKKYDYNVRCDFDQGNPLSIETSISFIVDRTIPSAVSITTQTQNCSNSSLSALFNATDNIGVLGYVYKVSTLNKTIIQNTFTTESLVSLTELNLTRNERYIWEVYAVDSAGNNGTLQKTAGTTILPEGHELCRENAPPYLNVSAKFTESGILVNLKCIDSDGLCQYTDYGISNSKNNCNCDTCIYSKYDSSTITITENTVICYKIKDNKNKSVESNVSFIYSDCTSGSECCAGKKVSICNGECKVISDVQCDPNKIDSDLDGIPDVKEIECGLDKNNQSDASADNDGDGLTNKEECLIYLTNINEKDTDGDGATDKEEVNKGTNPNDKTSFPINPNADTDGDGIIDTKEKECGLDPEVKDANLDNDGDGLTNKEECNTYKTNVNKADTDGDKVSDKVEIEKGTDPRDKESFPKSTTMSIILFIFGIILIVGGIFVFSQEKMPKIKEVKKDSKPLVDFKQAKQDIHQEIQQKASETPKYQEQYPAFYQSNLDTQIKKKQHTMKMRKMSSIFDEFAEERKVDMPAEKRIYRKLEELPQQKQTKEEALQRLDNLSKKDVFEELEVMGKKEDKKISDEENEKLDRLSKRGKR